MENILLLNIEKPSSIDFDLDLQGVDPSKEPEVRLTMYIDNVLYSFQGKRQQKGHKTFIINIPALQHVKKTTYTFTIEVMCDGYYFEALKGEVNISGDPLAHVTPITMSKNKQKVEKPDGLKKENNETNAKKEEKANINKKSELKKNKNVSEDALTNFEASDDILTMGEEEQENLVKDLLQKFKTKDNISEKKETKKSNIIIKKKVHSSQDELPGIKEENTPVVIQNNPKEIPSEKINLDEKELHAKNLIEKIKSKEIKIEVPKISNEPKKSGILGENNLTVDEKEAVLTHSIDTEKEQKVKEALSNLKKSKTAKKSSVIVNKGNIIKH